MLNSINLFFTNILFTHAGEFKIRAFCCNPKRFDW